MTSRSRVQSNSKHKVTSQNLGKFEQYLAKIPEPSGVRPPAHEAPPSTPTSSSTTSGDRSVSPQGPETPVRASAPSTTPANDEAAVKMAERQPPDISPSMTMGNAVTAEYEQFCKAFHSEITEVLTKDHLHGNPIRQLFQSASAEAHQRPEDPTSSTIESGEDSHAIPLVSGQVSVPPPMPPKVSTPTATTPRVTTNTVARVVAARTAAAPKAKPPRVPRRWSESPLGAPVFLGKKFVKKTTKSGESVTDDHQTAHSTAQVSDEALVDAQTGAQDEAQAEVQANDQAQARSHAGAHAGARAPTH
ncbi:hypothetical protein HPB47_004859 [Ixodes persulcatus]|uniref:Uncharacterized protein n=1 Tax=Ixodes persulcatus TaxID=34615 RepID=A0AC60PFI0_IXOPE|nr:hypothetical protein HPB47_004859 [Ixodes persulcatus]